MQYFICSHLTFSLFDKVVTDFLCSWAAFCFILHKKGPSRAIEVTRIKYFRR